MNEELQRELAAWLASMRDSAQSASNFALEQAPLIVQEKVLYGRITSTLAVVVLLVFMLGCARLAVRWWPSFHAAGEAMHVGRWGSEEYQRAEKQRESFGVRFGLASFLSVAAMPLVVAAAAVSLKVWFAPRLYIVEWLASLVK